MKLKILALCFLSAVSFQSHALFNLQLVGGANSTTAKTDANVTTVPGNGMLYGALVEFGMGFMAIQTGAIYTTRQVGIEATAATVTVKNFKTTTAVQVPLYFRFEPISLISFGIGPVLYMGQGNVKEKQSDNAGVAANNFEKDVSYSDAGLKQNDFAAAASLQIRLPFSAISHFVLGVDYHMGLSNVSDNGISTTKLNTMQYYGGFGFGF